MLLNKLGKGRAKKGMFEGDLINGELEIGQVSSLINSVKPVADIVKDILAELDVAKRNFSDFKIN